jgi:hypothetical protein
MNAAQPRLLSSTGASAASSLKSAAAAAAAALPPRPSRTAVRATSRAASRRPRLAVTCARGARR